MINYSLRLVLNFGTVAATALVTLLIIAASLLLAVIFVIVFDHSFYPSLLLSVLIPTVVAPPVTYFLVNLVKKLDRAEKEVSAVIENVSDAIFMHGRDGKLIDFNEAACQSLGYSRRELLNLSISDIQVDFNQERYAAYWNDPALDRTLTLEARNRRKDGSDFPVEVQVSAFQYGDELKILSIARDITKRKQAQEKARINQTQLAHAARVSAMGEMATGLAHELNQPLAAMAAYVDGTLKRLEGGEPLTDDIFKALHKASAQAHRAGEIIRRLRDFIGNIETRTEPIDLNQTIQTVAEMMDAELRLAEVKLDLNFERPLPLVAGDPILIQQVIFNLARNGVEAMAGNSAGMRTIKIDTSAKNNNVRISINDTGPGISEGDQAKLFDPFFTTKETGLGMGLAICHSIIDDIGGRIWFECQGGIGSVFHIDLPELEGDGTNADLEKLAS